MGIAAVFHRGLLHLPSILVAALLAQPAFGQDAYPSKPMTILVPFGPGTLLDTLARTVSVSMAEKFGNAIIVENRTGAGGAIALGALSRANPDGYTTALTSGGTITLLPFIQSVQYNSATDFSAISVLGQSGNLIVTTPSFPAKTLGEMLALAKSRPDPLTVGVSGADSRIVVAKLTAATGVKFTDVLYAGSSQTQPALLGGHINLAIDSIGAARGLIRDGKYRALAIASKTRSSLLPDVPSVSETVPGYSSVVWYGLITVARTPTDRVQRLYRDLSAAFQTTTFNAALASSGVEFVGSSPNDAANFMKADLEENQKIVQQYFVSK